MSQTAHPTDDVLSNVHQESSERQTNHVTDEELFGQQADSASIINLVKTKEWLESQLLELKTLLHEAQNPVQDGSDAGDPEELEKSVSELQTELQDACAEKALRSLLLSRVQYSSTLLKHVFTELTDDSGQDEERQRLLARLFVKQAALIKQIMKIHQENQVRLEKLNELKVNNLSLKQDIRSLMHSLMTAKDLCQDASQNKDDGYLKAKQSLINAEQKTEIVRHMLQSLILGSGINWAEDADLTKLLLSLGRPLDEQI